MTFSGNEPLIDHSRFGERVAKYCGVPGKATTDFDDALNWLELEPNSPHKSELRN